MSTTDTRAAMIQQAQRDLRKGAKYAYDHDCEDIDESPAPPAKDFAHAAARGIITDLCDRGGIKRGFEDIEHETRIEIVEKMAEIIRQAATEAAKATGTAGERPALTGNDVIEMIVGHLVSIVGGRNLMKGEEIGFSLDDLVFVANAAAARQTAPVVDDEAPKRVIDYITAFDKRLIGRGFDHAQRMEIVGLLVSKETQDAALAATAAPVLSDEQILANETLKYYFGLNGGKGPVSDKGHNIIQAVLTVATRSQP